MRTIFHWKSPSHVMNTGCKYIMRLILALPMAQIFKYMIAFVMGGLCSLFVTMCVHDNLSESIFFVEKEMTYNEKQHELIITLNVYDGHGQGIFSGENIHHAFWNYEKYTKDHKKIIKIGLYNCRLAKFNADLAHADNDGNIILRIPRVFISSLNEVEISINGLDISATSESPSP